MSCRRRAALVADVAAIWQLNKCTHFFDILVVSNFVISKARDVSVSVLGWEWTSSGKMTTINRESTPGIS